MFLLVIISELRMWNWGKELTFRLQRLHMLQALKITMHDDDLMTKAGHKT